MQESMGWLRELVLNYPALKYFIIFFGSAFGGEPFVIALSFLAAQKFFAPVTFFIVGFAGVFCSDSLYFFLGRTSLARKMVEHRYTTKTISVIIEAINRLSRGRQVVAFVLAKFMVGTRAIIIIFVSKTGINFSRFMRHDFWAIVVWFTSVSAIGYLSGLGFADLSRILENIYAGVGFLLIILMVLVILQIWFKKVFAREEEKIIREQGDML